MDNLVVCKKCGSNACYEQHIDEQTTTWLCMGCGFTTSTLMTEKSPVVVNYKETSPELYKDTIFKDDNDRVWVPSVITLPGRGMVFLDGTNAKDWKWCGMKATLISEEEKGRYPEGQTHKMDNTSMKHFGQKDFMDALEYIGFFEAQFQTP